MYTRIYYLLKTTQFTLNLYIYIYMWTWLGSNHDINRKESLNLNGRVTLPFYLLKTNNLTSSPEIVNAFLL